jgi:hypothetical protein
LGRDVSAALLRPCVAQMLIPEPNIEEKRASTKKGYEEIWNNHIRDRVGHIRMREFRTVDAQGNGQRK